MRTSGPNRDLLVGLSFCQWITGGLFESKFDFATVMKQIGVKTEHTAKGNAAKSCQFAGGPRSGDKRKSRHEPLFAAKSSRKHLAQRLES